MYNTGNAVPSAALEDMADNAQTFDALVTKTEGTTTDRNGVTRRVFQQILMDMGFQPLSGSFQTGATITARNQTLYDEVSHVFYAWGGTLPKVVPAGSTPATSGGIGAGAWTDKTDLTLRSELIGDLGASLLGNGVENLSSDINSRKPLSFYGGDRGALVSLLDYAKTTSRPVRLTSDVTVTTLIDIDFAGAKLDIDFAGFSILSDSTCLRLRNLATQSVMYRPSLKNITAPWCISRWNSDEWIISPASVLATLTQTNGIGFYQPTSNDSDIWSSLTSEQQNQNISPKIEIYTSADVKVYNPSGRFALYEFYQCHRCEVFYPNVHGGKGVLGTIVFNNSGDTGYGSGNKVHGGRVDYGSFSGVSFIRNKKGGVDSAFIPYRCGESGVKTFQNNINGRSARCYRMSFSDIFPYQTVFDGVDFNADYGSASERTDDFTLAQYPWNQLPTAHSVHNIQAKSCRQTGVWGDGQFNSYADVNATECLLSGIWLRATNSKVSDASVNECNISNSSGYNQLTIDGAGNTIASPFISTSASITEGQAIYILGASTLIDEKVVGNLTGITAPLHGTKRVDKLIVGSESVSETGVAVDLHPRGRNLANGAAELSGVIQVGSSGAETGYGQLKARAGGSLVHGVKALPDAGGIGLLAVGTSINGSWLANNEILFYQSGTSIVAVCKLTDGTVKTAIIIV